jgi:hypothetical protein
MPPKKPTRNPETPVSDEGSDAIDWTAILAAAADGGDDEGRSLIRLTPERVAILALEDCTYHLDRSVIDINRLALAAKAAHLALQAAMTAALAGSASIGAHPPKLRGEYLQYFENRRSGPAAPPESDRVMSFGDLLATATESPLPWSQAPLALSDDERALLERLTKVRHAIEHPKQSHHSIEPAYVAEALPVAARLTAELLGSVFHHLEPREAPGIEAMAASIAASAATHLHDGDG